MAVIDVTKMWSKSGGSFNSQLRDAFDQSFAFTEGYQVLSDTVDDNITLIIDAAGLPRNGDQHPSGFPAFVTSIRATPIGPIFWLVEVGYEGESNEPATVDVAWSSVMSTEPIDRDFAGRAIVTANGEQVEGLSMDISDAVVVITRKFATFTAAQIAPYWRSTNSDFFLGYPPGTARLMGFEARNQFAFGRPNEAWTVTARVQFREPYFNTTPAQAWYKRWRHEGLLVKYADNVIRRAVDASGQEETKPVLLKADGTRESDPDQAVFIHTQVYGSLPYSALGLV
jgi:hypothetical protein